MTTHKTLRKTEPAALGPPEGKDPGEFWEPLASAGPVTSELKIKRSLFIGHLGLCKNERDVRAFLELVESGHRNATHNCWAYLLNDPETEHSSDDGEPSGTAGKPILSAVRRSGMVNLMVVVTRYYGGINLGIRGLIEAYGQAAGDAAAKTERVLRIRSKKASVRLPYSMIGEVAGLLEACGTPGAGTWKYETEAEVCAEIRLTAAARAEAALDELLAKKLIFSWGWL